MLKFLRSLIFVKSEKYVADLELIVIFLRAAHEFLSFLDENVIVYATIKNKKFVKRGGKTKCTLKNLIDFDLESLKFGEVMKHKVKIEIGPKFTDWLLHADFA